MFGARMAAAELNDETLRDGIQSPSARHPPLSAKREALHLMARLGVRAVSLGLPAAGLAQRRDVQELLQETLRSKLDLEVHCAGRTRVEDLEPVAEIVQRVGAPLGVYAFLGSSPIRRYAEGWELDDILRTLESALRFAAREGLELAFVTEDTVRSRPEDLRQLFAVAIRHGARRLVLCDTVGHATPRGTERLVRFARDVTHELGAADVALDWHGHDDRGLAVANSLAAEAAGVDRVHATMLGMGERCGNAALDQLLSTRETPIDVEALERYRDLVCGAFDWKVSPSYPWPNPQLERARTTSTATPTKQVNFSVAAS